METRRQAYVQRLGALKQDRSSWEPTWRELSRYIDPWRGRFDANDNNKGGRKDQHIIDNAGRFALRTMASGLMSGLTSPARPWFRLSTTDPEMMEQGDVRDWLYSVENRMREVFARSNLYNALHTLYGDLGLFGTAAMSAMEDEQDVVRFYPHPVGTFCVSNNERLLVDTFYRETTLSVRQVMARFDEDKISEHVKNLSRNNQGEQRIEIVHLIEPLPKGEKIPGKLGKFLYRSVWFEKNGEEGVLLREAGLYEFPTMAPRWEVNGEDSYGYAPGFMALGDVKSLQLQQRRKAQAIDKHIDPPMVASPALRHRRSSLLPGDVTYVDAAQGNVGFQPAYVIKPELQSLLMDNQELRQRINTAFFADLFLMLANDNRSGTTAREIQERHEEKLLMLGPVLERLDSELLDRLIDRTFAIMVRRGMIPPAPDVLQGDNLKVEYISVLAQAQKMTGLGSIDRVSQFVMGMSQVNADVLDKLDMDQAVDEYGAMIGTPPTIIRDDDKVAAIRAQRQQAQAQQQAMQAAPAAKDMAQAAKALGDTDMDSNSALNSLGNGVRQAANG